MQYSKDIKAKFQVKFLHEVYRFPIPLIAAIQGINRATAHFRYQSVSDEIERYEDTRLQYREYVEQIGRCKISAALFVNT